MTNFFKMVRNLNNQLTVKQVIEKKFGIYIDALVKEFEDASLDPTKASVPKEPVILCILSELYSNNAFSAKNSLNDKILEYSTNDLRIVLSVKHTDGNGKFSVTGNKNFSFINVVSAIIFEKIFEYLDENKYENVIYSLFKGNDDFKDSSKYLDLFHQLGLLCEDIRNYLYNIKDEWVFDSSKNFYNLDLNLNLPHLRGFKASWGFVPDKQFVQSKAVDFLDVVVSDDNNGTVELKTFQDVDSYCTTPDRKFNIDEEILIAENEERTKNMVISPQCKNYLDDYFDLAQVGIAPTCCAFYGPSGAGKTVSAQVIARELHRPYVSFKMRENSDEDSLKGTIRSLNGDLIEYNDTPIIKALKNGWVCEIQELSVATNQGAETFFNPILDKSKTFEDASGETFNVHPDALLIFTYNPSYCENNQIATSLLNRIEDQYMIEFPDVETTVKILMKETGYTDQNMLEKIYNLCFGDGSEIASIKNYLEENDVEEELSLRQVINWINRYCNCRRYNNQTDGWLKAAEHTIIQALGQRELDVQDDIRMLIDAVM